MSKFFEKHKIKIFVFLLLLYVVLSLVSFSLKIQLDNATYKAELHDCYICGDSVEISQVNDSYHIECDVFKGGCGLDTGYYTSKKELAEKWNSIADDELKGEMPW